MHDISSMSKVAEIAIRRLALRTADLRNADHAPFGGGRHLPTPEFNDHTSMLVDLVAITEAYFGDRLEQAFPSLSRPDTWRSRTNAWRVRAGVDIAADPRWPAFIGFVEARNALQHGLGRLTEKQLNPIGKSGREPRRTEVLRALAASGLTLDGDRLIVTRSDVKRCAAHCRELIMTADAALS